MKNSMSATQLRAATRSESGHMGVLKNMNIFKIIKYLNMTVEFLF